jgi:hypothetical protein
LFLPPPCGLSVSSALRSPRGSCTSLPLRARLRRGPSRRHVGARPGQAPDHQEKVAWSARLCCPLKAISAPGWLTGISPATHPPMQSPDLSESRTRRVPHYPVLRPPPAVSCLRLQGSPLTGCCRHVVKQPAASSLRSWLCFGVSLQARLFLPAPAGTLSRGSVPLSAFCDARPLCVPGVPTPDGAASWV